MEHVCSHHLDSEHIVKTYVFVWNIIGCGTVFVTSLSFLKWLQLKQPKIDAGISIYICSQLEPESNLMFILLFCLLNNQVRIHWKSLLGRRDYGDPEICE